MHRHHGMLRNRKERKMKTIFLTRHAETEDIGSSLHKVFSEIEQITEQDYNVVKLKNDLSTQQDLDTWILQNAMHADLLITADPYALKVLKENGWQGKTILKALGGFPRGASSFRRRNAVLIPERCRMVHLYGRHANL